MRCSQLFVFFFLLIHSVASLPTPPSGLLPSAKRSQPGYRPVQPTASTALASSRGSEELRGARSAVLSDLSVPLSRSSSPSVNRPVAHGATSFPKERSVTLEDDGRASTSLLPRAPAPVRPAENWKKPLMGIGIIGTVLTAIGGLASYKAWLKERDRRRKKEQQQARKPKAQPPGVQHPVVQAPQDGPWCMGC